MLIYRFIHINIERTAMANRLELMWYGKDDPLRIEPRLLIENTELSNVDKDSNTENMLIQNLEDMSDKERIKGDAIDFEGYNSKKEILSQLRMKSEIDYSRSYVTIIKI